MRGRSSVAVCRFWSTVRAANFRHARRRASLQNQIEEKQEKGNSIGLSCRYTTFHFYFAFTMQPEAGPSRLPAATYIQPLDSPGHAPQSNPSAGTFSSGVDFIAFVDSDDDRPKQPTREWDRGKPERDRRERERDGGNVQAVSKKRRWEDSERDDVPAGKDSRRVSTHNVNLKSRKAPWAADVDWDSCRNVAQMCVSLFLTRYYVLTVSCYCLGKGFMLRWRRFYTISRRLQSNTKCGR